MDHPAFERAVRKQKDRLYAYGAMLLRDPAEAQDVVQEAMLKLWQHRDSVEAERSGMWLKKTTHNLCIDRIRRRKARREVVADDADASAGDRPGPERLARSGQLGRRIEAALGELSARDRAVLVLREVQRRPYAEIAELLDLPLGTLKARLHRARETLRKKLVRAGVAP